MVIMQLDVKNAFGCLCARLVLDVLSGKASRDYACGIKIDEEFETAVYELKYARSSKYVYELKYALSSKYALAKGVFWLFQISSHM